jgi:cytochrome b subunit of formate dehydrogenase
MNEKILAEKNLVVRHSTVELIEHWAVAISGLILLLTGIFELPVGKRYYIVTLPGLGWSADFITSLYLHYAAAFIFTATAIFHLFYHGLRGDRGLIPRKGDIHTSIEVMKSFFGKGKEPPFHKYLPEQRLAYIGMAVIIAMLIFSGLVKTYKNIYAPDMSYTLVLWATWIHNIFFIFFFLAFLAHIAAVILKPNRPMLRGILTGSVNLDYALHRHPLWIAEIEGAEKTEQMEPLVPPAEDAPKSEEVPASSDTASDQISSNESAVEKETSPPVADTASEKKS